MNEIRLSDENYNSEPRELQAGDHLEPGIDIIGVDQKMIVHGKIVARVEYNGYDGYDPLSLSMEQSSGPVRTET